MLDQWRAVLGEVAVPAPAVDWAAVEAGLGTALPTDYRVLADNYPTLCIDSFLHVFHPAADWSLRDQNEVTLGRMRSHREDFPELFPHPLFPEPGGLLSWGCTDNADELLWLTVGEPDEWPVVVTDRDDWYTHDGGMLSFLGGMLRGEVRCPVLGTQFPSAGYTVKGQ
ncbi:hypothetical protein ABZX92_16155 [Lentzea sp. NPDC006480]|uniref:hypothetical protein n=1 Tax=Lentzea sp. NPDC006480 TaxID=3157176 RepID=UPI0033BA7A30